MVVAIGGGPIVSDMIQRAHNLGLNLSIMSDVEGASGDKSKSLKGNDYSFANPSELIDKLYDTMKDALKPDLTQEKLKEMVEQSYKSLAQSHLENNSITKTDITKDSHNK